MGVRLFPSWGEWDKEGISLGWKMGGGRGKVSFCIVLRLCAFLSGVSAQLSSAYIIFPNPLVTFSHVFLFLSTKRYLALSLCLSLSPSLSDNPSSTNRLQLPLPRPHHPLPRAHGRGPHRPLGRRHRKAARVRGQCGLSGAGFPSGPSSRFDLPRLVVSARACACERDRERRRGGREWRVATRTRWKRRRRREWD